MRVAVTGATGVIGATALPALLDAGHDVVALARTAEGAATLLAQGARPVLGSLGNAAALGRLLAGADAVCNVATRVPVGYAALRPRAWRSHDRLCSEGVRRLVAAAREAGVRRVVQGSVSSLYADHGDGWIAEGFPLAITCTTEPVAVGESQVQNYTCGSRTGVVLRLGTLVGDDPVTRFRLSEARRGRPVGLGSPEGWAHVLHTDDVGAAVVAALVAPSGTYNVGADPVRRADLVAGFAQATGRESVAFAGPLRRRLAGSRLEPLTRSLRVSSEHFTACTGWTPSRPSYDAGWLTGRRHVVGAVR